MRVKISYGVDIDKVPDEVQKIGQNGLEKLNETADSLSRVLRDISNCDGDYDLLVKILEKLRSNLTEVDSILGDVYAILEGLNTYNKGEKNVSEGRPVMDPGGNIDEQT